MRDTGFFAADPARLATAYQDGHGGGLEVWDPPEGQWSKPPAFGDGGGTEGRFAGGNGWDGGLGTSWLAHPAADLVVVVLTQRTFGGPDAVPRVHAALQEAAFDALADK
jgi:CubicO group peptidase (beta-lactamase class C family)